MLEKLLGVALLMAASVAVGWSLGCPTRPLTIDEKNRAAVQSIRDNFAPIAVKIDEATSPGGFLADDGEYGDIGRDLSKRKQAVLEAVKMLERE